MTATDPEPLRILGIDPGTIRTGFGVIQELRGKLSLLAAGAISPAHDGGLPERLLGIFTGLEDLISRHRPQEIAVEGLFHAKNARSALVLGHARGAALLAAARAALPVFEYAPREVKNALVGTGGAEKEQVRAMVRILLGLRENVRPLDASDGVAIAICHAHSRRLKALAREPRALVAGASGGLPRR